MRLHSCIASLSSQVYIFTISEEVLFEVDQLRECIQDECPEIEFSNESLDISRDTMQELSGKRSDILEESNPVKIK